MMVSWGLCGSLLIYRVFSHDVMAAILVFQNNETGAITKPQGVELYYVKTSFSFNKFA